MTIKELQAHLYDIVKFGADENAQVQIYDADDARLAPVTGSVYCPAGEFPAVVILQSDDPS